MKAGHGAGPRAQPTIERWGRLNWINKSRDWRDELDFRGALDVEKTVRRVEPGQVRVRGRYDSHFRERATGQHGARRLAVERQDSAAVRRLRNLLAGDAKR